MDQGRDTRGRGDPAEATVGLSDLLDRIASELGALVWLSEEIQGLAAIIAGADVVGPDDLHRLQQLDLLTQSLADLARAARLSSKVAPDADLDAATLAKEVFLLGLRGRLLAAGNEGEDATPSGVVSLF